MRVSKLLTALLCIGLTCGLNAAESAATPLAAQPDGDADADTAIEIAGAEHALKANERPAARALSVDALQKWYGKAIVFNGDAELAAKVQSAEALTTAIYLATDGALRSKWTAELLNLQLPSTVLRAVIRYGQVPLSSSDRHGTFKLQTPLLGFPDDSATGEIWIPENYTHDHPWPVIISLCSDLGTLQSAPGFIVINPDPHPGAPNRGYCWGPALVARAVPWSVLDWAMLHYRIDPDRIYLHGTGCYGGIGAKSHGVIYSDRLAALCPNGGPPLGPERINVYRNLHDLPLLYGEATADQGNVTGKWETDTLDKFKIHYETKGDEFAFFTAHTRERAPQSLHFSSYEDAPAALKHYYIEIAEADPAGNTEIIYNVKSFMNCYPLNRRSWSNDMMLEHTQGEEQLRQHYDEQRADAIDALKDPALNHPENGYLAEKDRALLVQLFSEKNIDNYRVLLKQATDAKLILETRPAWMKPREVDVHLNRDENAVVIERTAFVKRLRILIDDDVLDPDREITVRLGDKVLTRQTLTRSSRFMIEEMVRSHRRDRTFWGEIVVRVR